jgi:3-oxoacyl-[acyl-carrier-protein] synthase-3
MFPQKENIEQGNLEKLFSKLSIKSSDPFEMAMAKYIQDPFKGSKQRYYLGENETSLSLEEGAAKKAISLLNEKIDFLICCSFVPNNFGAGNAAYIVKDLNLNCPGINLESACSSSVIAFQIARDLIFSKTYKNILIVCSVTNSRLMKPEDTLSWFLGDCSSAFVVGEVEDNNVDILSKNVINTDLLTDMFKLEIKINENQNWRFDTVSNKQANKMAKESAALYLKSCVEGVLSKANLSLDDINYFIFNTPMAWYHEFCANTLSIPLNKCTSIYSEYGNIGNCLMPVTLHRTISEKKVKQNDVVLLYSIGSTSTAASIVFKVGKIKIEESQ